MVALPILIRNMAVSQTVPPEEEPQMTPHGRSLLKASPSSLLTTFSQNQFPFLLSILVLFLLFPSHVLS